MAVVFKSCLELYYHNHPSHRYLGYGPDYDFVEGFVHTFLEKELDTARLEEHGIEDTLRTRELIAKIKEHNSEIAQQLNISERDL
jgi:hypothetical protein